MTDERQDIRLMPEPLPPSMPGAEPVNELPGTLSEVEALTNTTRPPLDESSLIAAIDPDPDSAANIPATTVDETWPGYGDTNVEVTPEATVQGQLENILNEGGPLMDIARSMGDEYSNSRGMLNSSMGAQASQRAIMDYAVPIASQDAQTYLSQLQTNQAFNVQRARDSILQSYQLQMENLSTANKARLIGIEQQYAAAIQSDINASEVYVQTMQAIGQLMSTPELTIDQQNSGMNELVNMLDAYLDFNFNLNSVNALTGALTGEVDAAAGRLDATRADQADLSATQDATERNAKQAEYYNMLAQLGAQPDQNLPEIWDTEIQLSGGPNPAYNDWIAQKEALDAQYSTWLR